MHLFLSWSTPLKLMNLAWKYGSVSEAYCCSIKASHHRCLTTFSLCSACRMIAANESCFWMNLLGSRLQFRAKSNCHLGLKRGLKGGLGIYPGSGFWKTFWYTVLLSFETNELYRGFRSKNLTASSKFDFARPFHTLNLIKPSQFQFNFDTMALSLEKTSADGAPSKQELFQT